MYCGVCLHSRGFRDRGEPRGTGNNKKEKGRQNWVPCGVSVSMQLYSSNVHVFPVRLLLCCMSVLCFMWLLWHLAAYIGVKMASKEPDSRRFWKKEDSDDNEQDGSSSSDSSSDSGSDSDSSKDSQKGKQATAKPGKPKGFQFESDSDSEEDSRKRVAKSEQERRHDKLRVFVHEIRNAKKINDWSKIQESTCSVRSIRMELQLWTFSVYSIQVSTS